MNAGIILSLFLLVAGLAIVIVVFVYAWRKRKEKAPPHIKPVKWDDD